MSHPQSTCQVRAIIFDLGNVVLPFDHMRGCRAAARRSPLAPHEIYRRLFGADLVDRFDRGHINGRTFFAEARRLIDYHGPTGDLRRAWVEIFWSNPAMERLVHQLAGRVPLVLLSNVNRAHFQHVRRRYPIVRIFRRRVLSYEVGLLKPDPDIYRIAVSKAGCPATHCVYVDDKPDFARAAAAVGVTGLPFRGARRLRADLKRLGVQAS